MRRLYTIGSVIAILFFLFFILKPREQAITPVQTTFFPIQSMDTMKFSRDRAGDPKQALHYAEPITKKVKETGANYITIDTPYDEEFLPTLYEWVKQARKYNLKIWYRGNWAGWEGWFDYPKMTDINEHHAKTYEFILANPSLFEEGDIFTPAPEPENGIIGDPRESFDNGALFNQWLIDSYDNCTAAMETIAKKATCGYFSFNGDVARESVTKETYQHIGGLVIIDHYVPTAKKLRGDIEAIYQQFGLPVMLGEVGGPLDSVHGQMTEEEQAAYLEEIFTELIPVRHLIAGINYWEAFDSSTALFNKDESFKPRLGAAVVAKYYNPVVISGKVVDFFLQPVPFASVYLGDNLATTTDSSGRFIVLTVPGPTTIRLEKESFITKDISLSAQQVIAGKPIIVQETLSYNITKIYTFMSQE